MEVVLCWSQFHQGALKAVKVGEDGAEEVIVRAFGSRRDVMRRYSGWFEGWRDDCLGGQTKKSVLLGDAQEPE